MCRELRESNDRPIGNPSFAFKCHCTEQWKNYEDISQKQKLRGLKGDKACFSYYLLFDDGTRLLIKYIPSLESPKMNFLFLINQGTVKFERCKTDNHHL